MAKYPREEINYKKLYKKIDLDRDLEIKWPEIPQDTRETLVIDEKSTVRADQNVFIFDETDEEFCKTKDIAFEEFVNIFQILDRNFIQEINKEMDKIKPSKPGHSCDICGKSKNNENKLIICQGCLITVHEDCYGVVDEINERWLCRKCIFHYEVVKCKFCDNNSGMLKKTDTNEWAHVVCAQIIPGLSFINMNIKDPIETNEIQPYEGICSICSKNGKYLIKCSHEECNAYYHSSCCAEHLYCDLGNRISYCKIHDPIKNRMKIVSKRNRLKNINMYPEIENKIVLRHNMKFSVPKMSMYRKIVSMQPKVIKKGLKQYRDSKNLKEISEHWKKRRESMGFYFEDMFMFPNYFLRKNKEN